MSTIQVVELILAIAAGVAGIGGIALYRRGVDRLAGTFTACGVVLAAVALVLMIVSA